jgi:hypothetical protein
MAGTDDEPSVDGSNGDDRRIGAGSNGQPPEAPSRNDDNETSDDESEESEECLEGRCPECGDLGPRGCLCSNCEDSGLIYDAFDPTDDFPYELDDEEEEEDED